ncbi:LysR family transcriptional regulator [Rhodoferax aquaticus]|nr:LysR family transcriptional regulator [Rhodoferax aquaticus]
MNEIQHNLRRLDLNLLQLFHALYRLRSVTEAAHELAMSPSAFSHGLSRLRVALDDALFVRQGTQMVPTTKSIAMADSISLALKLLGETLERGQTFHPSRSERTFTFASTDFTAFAVLPKCIAAIQKLAPHLSLRVRYADHNIPLDDLRAGRVDFSIGYDLPASSYAPDIVAQDWFVDQYVVVSSKNHAVCSEGLTLESYLACKHVVVTPWNQARGDIDQLLDDLNLQRQVAVHLPTVLAAPFIVGHSDMLMTMPRLAARTLQQAAAIALHTPPFAIPDYCVKLFSHANYAQSDAHAWMADTLLNTTLQ